MSFRRCLLLDVLFTSFCHFCLVLWSSNVLQAVSFMGYNMEKIGGSGE